MKNAISPGFSDMLSFPLIEALLGRRSRRFFAGAEIPDGVFAYTSTREPVPLSEFEKMLVLSACAGNTSWHHMIFRAARYAPHLSNYAGAAGGRVFPSAAGFHTSQTFFTDDDGVYLVDMRDAAAFAEREGDGGLEPEALSPTPAATYASSGRDVCNCPPRCRLPRPTTPGCSTNPPPWW